MKAEVKKSFIDDLEAITDKKLAQRIKTIMIHVEVAKTLSEVPNLKKMQGSTNAFRIRIGDYRIGFFLVNDTVQFTAFGHRKEIYRNFP